jgi:hypothetical protein
VTVNDAGDDLLAGMRSGESAIARVIATTRGDRELRESLDLYVRPDLGAMRWADVRRRHVQALADRLVGEGAAPSTVRNAIMPLRVVYRGAA